MLKREITAANADAADGTVVLKGCPQSAANADTVNEGG